MRILEDVGTMMKKIARVLMTKGIALVAIITLGIYSHGGSVGYVFAAHEGTPHGASVTICHATSSGPNPFEVLSLPEAAVEGAHGDHDGDIIPITDLNDDGDIDEEDCELAADGGDGDGDEDEDDGDEDDEDDGDDEEDDPFVQTTGTIMIIKTVVNDDGGSATSSDFMIHVTGTNPSVSAFAGSSAGTQVVLEAGDYAVTEDAVAGYTGSFSTDCTGTMTAGASLTCTIINDDDEADIEPEDPDQCLLPNLLLNGSFEAVDAREGLVRATPLDGLAAASPKWDVYDSLPDVTDGTSTSWSTVAGSGPEVQYSGVVVTPYDGLYYVELDSHANDTNGSGTNSAILQTVDLDGGDYELSFWFRPRRAIANDNPIDVYIDGARIGTADGTDTSAWVNYTFTLSGLSAGTHDVMFHATGTQNSFGGLLDAVSLACADGDTDPDPEPEPEPFVQTTGTLMIFKTVVNDDGGASASGDFTIHVTGTNPSLTSFPGSASGTLVVLEEGAYAVSEDSVDGYAGAFSADCTGTMTAGAALACTITNDDKAGGDDGGDDGGSGDDDEKVGADLELEKEASIDRVIVGSEFTYTLTVTNLGPEPATGVTVADSLPDEVVHVTSTATLGSYDPVTGIWTIGSMAVDQVETLSILVRVTSVDSGFYNYATTTAIEIDPRLDNNTDSARVRPSHEGGEGGSCCGDNSGGSNGGGNNGGGNNGGGNNGGGSNGGSTGGGNPTPTPTPTPIVLGDQDTFDGDDDSDVVVLTAPEPVVLGASTDAEETLPVTGVPSSMPAGILAAGLVAMLARSRRKNES